MPSSKPFAIECPRGPAFGRRAAIECPRGPAFGRRAAILALLAASACGDDHPAPSAKPSASAAGSSSAAAAAATASASPSGSAAAAAASASAASSAAPEAPKADPAKLVVKGEPIQGGLLHAKVEGKVKHIGFPGHKTTILDDGEFLIAFGRTALPKETLTLTFEDGSVLERAFDVEQRTYETDKIDNLPKDQVDLDAATKKKVAKAEAQLDAERMRFSKVDCFRGPFAWPVKGKISSHYGQPRVLNGKDAGPHWGVDIVAKVGTPVKAPACGKVVHVEENVPLSGNVVVIDHGRGLTSTLIHLDKFKVKVGDDVKAGQQIATVGKSGRSTGPHLDWRMNLYDIRIDAERAAK